MPDALDRLSAELQRRLEECGAATQDVTTADQNLIRSLKEIVGNKAACDKERLTDLCVLVRKCFPASLTVRQITDSVIQQEIQPWHWHMLNDQLRNDAYNLAIKANVSENSVVLEIGAGTGMLAILAARAGAKHVYTCELSKYLSEIATKNIRAAGLSDKITVINKRSDALEIGVDLPEKCDVLIHEIMSGDLVAEGVFESLKDARDRLLTENCVYLPDEFWVNIQPVLESPFIERHSFERYQDIDLSELNIMSPSTLKTDQFNAETLTGSPQRVLVSSLQRDAFRLRQRGTMPISGFKAERVAGFIQWITFSFPGGVVYENRPGSETHWFWRFFSADLNLSDFENKHLSCEYFDERLVFDILDAPDEAS